MDDALDAELPDLIAELRKLGLRGEKAAGPGMAPIARMSADPLAAVSVIPPRWARFARRLP